MPHYILRRRIHLFFFDDGKPTLERHIKNQNHRKKLQENSSTYINFASTSLPVIFQ